METVLQKKLESFKTRESLARHIYVKRNKFHPQQLLKLNRTINYLLGYDIPTNPTGTKSELILKQILYKGPDKGKAKPMSVLNNSNSTFTEMLQTLLLGMYCIDEEYMNILTIDRRKELIKCKNVYKYFVGHLTPKNLDVTLWMHLIYTQSLYECDFFIRIKFFPGTLEAVEKNWKYVCMRTNFFIRYGLRCIEHDKIGCDICQMNINYMRTRVPCIDHGVVQCVTCSALSKYIVKCIKCKKCSILGCKSCIYTVMQPLRSNVECKRINLARNQAEKLIANQGKHLFTLESVQFDMRQYMKSHKNITPVLKLLLSLYSNVIVSQKKDAILTDYYMKLIEIQYYRLPVSGTSGRTVQYCIHCRSCTSNIINLRGKCTNFINSDFKGICSICKQVTLTLYTFPFAYIPVKLPIGEKKYKLTFRYLKHCKCCRNLFISEYQRDTCCNCDGWFDLCYFTNPFQYRKLLTTRQYHQRIKLRCKATRKVYISKDGNLITIKVCENHFRILEYSEEPTVEFGRKHHCTKFVQFTKYG